MSAFFTTEHLLANDAGREYRLRIWRPVNIAVGSRLNTLLLLDGHWLDDTLDAALDTVQAGTVQVASLGYRVADRSLLAPWPAYDYPPSAPLDLHSDPRNADRPCCGAEPLQAFLRLTILPQP